MLYDKCEKIKYEIKGKIMCGIVGYFGKENVEETLISKLKLLEYRGYDSAGIAVKCGSEVKLTKAIGEIKNLEAVMQPLEGAYLGIAHTRWATHGKPSEDNAHPHVSENSDWTIVHNGIIENYEQLKTKLVKSGYHFYSDTDTEIVAKLLEYYRKKVTIANNHEALIRCCSRLEGSYALAVINRNQDKIYFAKNKSPLYCALNGEEFMLASDPICFAGFAKEYYALKDKEFGYYMKDRLVFFNDLNAQIEKKPVKLDASAYDLRNDYPHFMIKEINESKRVLENIRDYYSEGTPLKALEKVDWEKIDDIKIVGCGTAFHAGLLGANIIEKFLGIECNAYVGSEFRYKNPKIGERSLVILVSQSGETADTLAALEIAREKGAVSVAVVNVEYSALAKSADIALPIKAGVEIAVASTKAYIAQISVLYILAVKIASLKFKSGYSLGALDKVINAIGGEDEQELKYIANKLQYKNDLYMIGRGDDYCTAQEACLKIKETSYINANTYFAGELKHGFLALIEEKSYVIVFATEKDVLSKTLANAAEAKARGARLIVLTDIDLDEDTMKNFYHVLKVPKVDSPLQAIVNIIPWQKIAYYMSIGKGYNPDKPRNLAKSVTVE